MARRRSKRQKRRMLIWTLVLLAAALLPVGIRALRPAPDAALAGETREAAFPLSALRFEDLPPYEGQLVIELDGNRPALDPGFAPGSAVLLSELDALGRTGPAFALIGPESLPSEPRGEIGDVRPAGFHNVRYDDLIEDRYLYNRCHVIAYQLSGINADARDLFTGTRYLNVEGMLPLENELAAYVRHSGGAVLYRVTPIYAGAELVPRGVEMEALALAGGELRFHVFVYNVQPGIEIDYADGGSRRES